MNVSGINQAQQPVTPQKPLEGSKQAASAIRELEQQLQKLDAEKQKALNLLMKQYYPDRTENFVFRPEVVAMTEIFCLKVEHMTGKKRFKMS